MCYSLFNHRDFIKAETFTFALYFYIFSCITRAIFFFFNSFILGFYDAQDYSSNTKNEASPIPESEMNISPVSFKAFLCL